MDSFNFNLLKYFYYIVIYNGFTNASRNLSVAQPSLSLNVKRLEEELGYKVIEKNIKQFKLTEEGNNLFKSIKPFFESIEHNLNFQANLKNMKEINIAVKNNYDFLLSAKVIKKIITEFPNIKLNVKLYSLLDSSKLKDGDYTIVIDEIDYVNLINNIKIESISKLRNYFICSNNLNDIYKNVKSISDLEKSKLISYTPSLKNGKFNGLCYNYDVNFIDVISVNESDLYFDYVNNDCGIGFTNELLLANQNNVNKINVEEDIFEDEIVIAYLNENDMITKIAEIIKENVKEIL